MNWVIVVFVQTIGSFNYDNIYLEVPAFQTNYVFSEYAQCANKAAELKRKPQNRWVFQQKYYGRVYECEEYDGDDLLDVLKGIPMVEEVTIDDLLEMGWHHRGKVIQFDEVSQFNKYNS